MKKRFNLLLIPFAILSSTPVMASLASCSRTYDYTQEVLNEFLGNEKLGIKGLVSCPRPGGYYDAIIPYLTQRVKDIAGLKDDQIFIDPHHNIHFDIPATKGYEDSDMVILQGHTDMIVAGMSKEEAKTTPIDAVIDNGTVHSRDFKTSIGSDDGSGVSIALTILRHRNDFVHGPIRFLLTADEDSGMIGAKYLSHSWLKYNNEYIKWLINIDAEEEGYVYRSCAGFIPLKISNNYDKGTDQHLGYEYTLLLDGLSGGHSGIDIIKKLANADRLAYEFLYYLINDCNAHIQLIEHNHEHITETGETQDVNYSANQLIGNSKVLFRCDLDSDTIKGYFDQMIDFWKQDRYPAEDWTKISSISTVELVTEPISEYHLSTDDSEKIIEKLGNYNDPVTATDWNAFHYGVLEYDDHNIPKSSVNMGPVSIKLNENKIEFKCETSSRSSIGDYKSFDKYSINWLRQQYNRIARDVKEWKLTESSTCYPWIRDDDNKLVNILVDGYKKLGVTPTIFDSLSGVEPAMWTLKSQGQTVCSCVGPRTDHAHSMTETLYIDTIEPCLKNIIAALEQITKGI